MFHPMLRIIRDNVLLILVLFGSAFLGGTIPAVAQVPAPDTGTITGTAYRLVDQTIVDGVVIDETLEPLSDGRIAIPELSIDRPLAAGATFAFDSLPASADRDNPTEVTVIFTAPGWGSFTYLYLRIGPGYQPVLTPLLIDTPRVNDLSLARNHSHEAFSPDSETPSLTGQECAPSVAPNAFPQTIRVWENAEFQDGLVHDVPFKFYVKHVLPKEWRLDWHTQSLRAGAMAVKSFAWWHARNTHTHTTGPAGRPCYDVDAMLHQVFDRTFSDPRTNAAVDATWNFYMIRGGNNVVHAMHKQGAGDTCAQWNGGPRPGNDMSQFGSQACALLGLPWPQILREYYFPPLVSWTLLNATTDTDQDGCSTLEEFGPNAALGGQRNYLRFWDFLDVWAGTTPPTRDKWINIIDIGVLVNRFGASRAGGAPTKAQALAEALTPPTSATGYHAGADRAPPPDASRLWAGGNPDGQINIIEIGEAVAGFGHTCKAAP